jgi:DNA repair protein RecO (recombination protein O)
MSNPQRIELEPAYILHTRAYRETSQILEVFTAGYGRVGMIARGARRPKSGFRGVLNPFQPVRLSWSGRGELVTLTQVEPGGAGTQLGGAGVMAGFYVNELLLKLLGRGDPHPDLFAHYASLIAGLVEAAPVEPLLRKFELRLLYEIGYAPNLREDGINHEPLDPLSTYRFSAESGAVPATHDDDDELFTGAVLLGIGRMEFDSEANLKAAKRLVRSVLNFHLGDRGLNTRRVASAMKRQA